MWKLFITHIIIYLWFSWDSPGKPGISSFMNGYLYVSYQWEYVGLRTKYVLQKNLWLYNCSVKVFTQPHPPPQLQVVVCMVFVLEPVDQLYTKLLV